MNRQLEAYEYEVEAIYSRLMPQEEECPEKEQRPTCKHLGVNDRGLKKGALPICKISRRTCEMLALKRIVEPTA